MNLNQMTFNFVAKIDGASPDELYRARMQCLEHANDFAVHADSRALFGRMADLLYKSMSRQDWIDADNAARREGRSDPRGI